MITLDHKQLTDLVYNVATTAVNQALSKAGLMKPYMSIRQAHKVYGKTNVEKWLKAGLIKKVQDDSHSTVRLERARLDAVAATANRKELYGLNKKTSAATEALK